MKLAITNCPKNPLNLINLLTSFCCDCYFFMILTTGKKKKNKNLHTIIMTLRVIYDIKIKQVFSISINVC